MYDTYVREGKKFGESAIPTNISYDYDYPNGMDLRPNTADDSLHTRLMTKILSRAQDARSAVEPRYDRWQKVDEQNNAYIQTDEDEDRIKDLDPRKPVSIVIPIQWAAKETLLTYLVGALLDPPYFRYEGRGPEDRIPAMLGEKVIAAQATHAAMGLDMYAALADSLDYGLGISAPSWYEEWGIRRVVNRPGSVRKFFGAGVEEREEEMMLWEGGRLDTIRPYDFLPDPSVSAHKMDDGEFVGWIENTNLMRLLNRERHDETLFNVQYLKHARGATSAFGDDRSERNRDDIPEIEYPSANKVTLVHMFVELIPSEWELGDSDYPEKWMFTVANDVAIVRCQPMNLHHNRFPVCLLQADFSGHEMFPISRMEKLLGIQEAINWLMNSHIQNIRKVLMDMIVVDPAMVNVDDIRNPAPGKIIRLRRRAWGKGLDQYIKQLDVHDVTQNNIGDVRVLNDLGQVMSGAADILQGRARQTSERKSATEMSAVQQGALSRLQKASMLIDMIYVQPLAVMLMEHTRQFMQNETFVKILGRYEMELRNYFGGNVAQDRIRVTPDMLNALYDVVPNRGRVHASTSPQAALMALQLAQQDPELRQRYSITKLFSRVAYLSGFDNIQDFLNEGGNMEVNVASAEEIEQGVQKGNLLALGGGNEAQL